MPTRHGLGAEVGVGLSFAVLVGRGVFVGFSVLVGDAAPGVSSPGSVSVSPSKPSESHATYPIPRRNETTKRPTMRPCLVRDSVFKGSSHRCALGHHTFNEPFSQAWPMHPIAEAFDRTPAFPCATLRGAFLRVCACLSSTNSPEPSSGWLSRYARYPRDPIKCRRWRVYVAQSRAPASAW
jgi:hypothetical protein